MLQVSGEKSLWFLDFDENPRHLWIGFYFQNIAITENPHQITFAESPEIVWLIVNRESD
jgi:hypothetical protein